MKVEILKSEMNCGNTMIAAAAQAFKIKNTKIVGMALIGCGVALFLAIQFFAIPGLILFVIAGILALKEKNTPLPKI